MTKIKDIINEDSTKRSFLEFIKFIKEEINPYFTDVRIHIYKNDEIKEKGYVFVNFLTSFNNKEVPDMEIDEINKWRDIFKGFLCDNNILFLSKIRYNGLSISFPKTFNPQVYKLKEELLELTHDNILIAIENMLMLHMKLEDSSNIKLMREIHFGNVNGTKWKNILEEMEQQGKLLIKRTPSGNIREISIGDMSNFTDNYKIMRVMESRGKLKQKNSGYNGAYLYELYKYNLFPHIETALELDADDKFNLRFSYFSMKYARRIMEDMGVWRDFKNALKEKVHKKINEIENFLGVKIESPVSKFEYEEDFNGYAHFYKRDIKISLD